MECVSIMFNNSSISSMHEWSLYILLCIVKENLRYHSRLHYKIRKRWSSQSERCATKSTGSYRDFNVALTV